MRAAVIQLSCQEDVSHNLARAGSLADEAAAGGATLIVLPENFAFMGDEADKRRIAERLDGGGPIVHWLAALAARTRAYVIGGGMPEQSADPARPYNTSVLMGPDGRIAGAYRKLHLFDIDLPDGSQAYRESRSTCAGDEASVVAAGDMRLGMTVCYDLRFPELYRRLSADGARVVTVPAAFTLMTGKDHWHALLRARAIENQVFVLAAAQHGKHPGGRQTYGKSLIVDAWGDVIAQASDGEGYAIATLDFAAQDRVRAALPCLQHRRL
jgi:predicted amidohydrolase